MKYEIIHTLMKHMLELMDEETFKRTVDDLLDSVENYYAEADDWHEAVVIPLVDACRSVLDVPGD